jgi:hypothetical protein
MPHETCAKANGTNVPTTFVPFERKALNLQRYRRAGPDRSSRRLAFILQVILTPHNESHKRDGRASHAFPDAQRELHSSETYRWVASVQP